MTDHEMLVREIRSKISDDCSCSFCRTMSGAADEIERLRKASEWQLVETAPHGTDVILGWMSWHTQEWICEVGQASHGWSRNGISTMSRHGSATHWMPLPAPAKIDFPQD